jgi:hypothetical protein
VKNKYRYTAEKNKNIHRLPKQINIENWNLPATSRYAWIRLPRCRQAAIIALMPRTEYTMSLSRKFTIAAILPKIELTEATKHTKAIIFRMSNYGSNFQQLKRINHVFIITLITAIHISL